MNIHISTTVDNETVCVCVQGSDMVEWPLFGEIRFKKESINAIKLMG